MTHQEKLRIQKEVEDAILKSNKTYLWDWDGATWVFDLPSPQKSGTITQNATYARLKAERILNNIIAIERRYTELRDETP